MKSEEELNQIFQELEQRLIEGIEQMSEEEVRERFGSVPADESRNDCGGAGPATESHRCQQCGSYSTQTIVL